MRLLVAMPPTEVYSPANGGAIATVVEALARHWAADGHEVAVLSFPTDEPYATGTLVPSRYRWPEPSPARRVGIGAVRKVRRYDWPGYPVYVRDVRLAVRRLQPDWLLVHNESVLPAVLGRRPAGMRVAVTLHNTVRTRAPERMRRSLLASDVVTAVSQFIAHEAEMTFDLPRGTVTVVHNGVDNALYAGRAAGRPDGLLRVAYLGRMLRDKGPQVLLEALEMLAADGIAVELLVAGSPTFDRRADHGRDPFVQEVRERVAALGGTYTEHLDRLSVARVMAEQDVTVAPSLFDEPFALVVLEGMASGCAVITSDRGGLPEAAGGVATVLPAGDAAALARRLRELNADRAALLALQQAGLARAQANDWMGVAERWTRLLVPPGRERA